jgi:hypothetical protein
LVRLLDHFASLKRRHDHAAIQNVMDGFDPTRSALSKIKRPDFANLRTSKVLPIP